MPNLIREVDLSGFSLLSATSRTGVRVRAVTLPFARPVTLMRPNSRGLEMLAKMLATRSTCKQAASPRGFFFDWLGS